MRKLARFPSKRRIAAGDDDKSDVSLNMNADLTPDTKQLELENKYRAELERDNPAKQPDNPTPGITTEKPPPLIQSRNGAIQYAIAISIFLLGILLVVLPWCIPTMTMQNSIVFTVIGALVLLLGMMHIIAIPTMFA